MPVDPHQDSEGLRVIGLADEELHFYEVMLRRPGAALDELAVAAGCLPADAQRLLHAIESKGLASHTLEQPPRYRAAPPDVCFGALIEKQQTRLQSARSLVDRLGKIRPSSGAEDEEARAEVITGHPSLLQVMERLYASAREEVLCFDRPPYVSELSTQIDQKKQTLRQGVSYRTIIDAEALDVPGRLDHARVEIELGEQIRVCSGVPIKALIVDRRLALVPLHIEYTSQAGLLLRPSWLFDAMYALFELLWNQAASLGADGARDKAEKEVGELVSLLSSGSKDKVVAHQLGISDRTLERRINEMYQHLQARSRFQAGWKAAIASLGRAKKGESGK